MSGQGGEPSTVDGLGKGVLDATFRALLAATSFFVCMALYEAYLGRWSGWLTFEATALVATTVLLRPSVPERTRVRALFAGALLVGAMALMHFGPLLGVGAILSVAPLVAAVFSGPRAGRWATVAVAVTILGLGLCAERAIFEVTWVLPGAMAWARMSATTLLASLACVEVVRRAGVAAEHHHRQKIAAVSRAREADAAEARTRARLVRSEHHAALGRLAGGVAHDMNNALASIAANAELLRSTDEASARAELADAIRDTVQLAGSAIEQVVRMTRRAPELDEQCRPADVVTRFVEAIRPALSSRVTLRAEATSSAEVAVPTAVLERALLQAVLDARDAHPRGAVIEIGVHEERGEVAIEIVDRPGGSETQRGLYTPPPRDGDPLLGADGPIAIAAARGGGRCELRVEPRGATVVRLQLPAAARAAAPRRASGTRRRPLRVLLLEDEETVRRAIERTLARAGHLAIAVSEAEAARRLVDDETFDVLLTDAVVPGGGVAELVAHFVERHGEGRVIVCSGHVDDERLIDGVDRRDYAFLAKPFRPEVLVQEVERAAAQGEEMRARPSHG